MPCFITQNGWGPLTLACDNGYIDTVKLLIQRGADINILGEVHAYIIMHIIIMNLLSVIMSRIKMVLIGLHS